MTNDEYPRTRIEIFAIIDLRGFRQNSTDKPIEKLFFCREIHIRRTRQPRRFSIDYCMMLYTACT